MTILTFHMPNRLEAVDPMVLTLKGQLETVLPDDVLFRFDICMSESLANLVLHAKAAKPGSQIDVTLEITPGRVTAEVYDPEGAAAFDIRDAAQDLSDVDVMAEGGRGLGLILECADVVDYGLVNNRYRLLMTFLAENQAMNGVSK